MAEKGFKEPTEIQALTFPAAIMGRRDILGAAETGKYIKISWPLIMKFLVIGFWINYSPSDRLQAVERP